MSLLPAFLTVLLWSCSAACSARAAVHLTGAVANRWRLVAATGLLGALVALWGVLPHGQAAWWLLLSGAVGLGLGDLAMFTGYQLVGARLVVLLTQALAVPLAAGLEWAWLGAAMNRAEIACTALAVAGVVIALAPQVRTQAHGARLRLGIILGIVSACGLACSGVLTRRALAADDGSAVVLVGLAGGLGAALLRNLGGAALGFAWAGLRHAAGGDPPRPDWRRGLPWLIATSILGPGLGVACYQWALINAKAGLVQAVLTLVPIAVMPMAWYTEGDRPCRWAWIGGAIAVAGAAGVALAHA